MKKPSTFQKVFICVLTWLFVFNLTYYAFGAYTQQHTFVNGETLTHTYLNNEFQELETQWSNLVETTGAQTIHGVKTFTSIPVLPATQPTSNTQAMRLESVAYLMRGKLSGLEITYKDADETYLSSGVVHINNGSNDVLYYSNAQITAPITGAAASTLYYIYVDPPASGQALVAADIEYSTSAPSWNATYHGFYHPTSTDQRCIGAIITDGSSNITEFYSGGNYFCYADHFQVLASTDVTNTWTDITLTQMPAFTNIAEVTFLCDMQTNANHVAYWRTDGQSGTSGHAMMSAYNANGQYQANTVTVVSSTAKGIEVRWNLDGAGSTFITAYLDGWHYPVGMRRN